jgi:DHA1 family bicyclomycin/chloramphenicol resistance-like MFS transporter
MLVGAICTALAGVGTDPALATALVLAGSGCLAQLSFWVAGRHMQQTETGSAPN